MVNAMQTSRCTKRKTKTKWVESVKPLAPPGTQAINNAMPFMSVFGCPFKPAPAVSKSLDILLQVQSPCIPWSFSFPLLWRFHFSDCRVMLVAGFRRMCPVPTVSFGSPPLLGVVELSQTTVADHLWPVRKQWLMKLYTFFMDVLVMLHDSVQYRSTVFVKQTYLCASTN